MKGLDLSKFTKVGTKDGKTTFKHKDGHWLSVAHKSLSQGHQKQIESLPSYNEETTNFAQGGTATPPVTPEGVSQGFKGAMGLPKPKLMAEGGEASPLLNYVKEGGTGAPEGPAQGVAESQDQAFQDTQMPPQPAQPSQSTPAPAQPTQMEQPQAPEQAPAQPDDSQGPQAVKKLLAGEAQNMESDLAQGHIKPETYKDLFAKKDTLGKIGTIFGMLVGGGLGGANTAIEMMDKEINRDLEAQRASASNAHNYLSLVQQNPMLQAQIQKLGADTKAINQATALTTMMQVSFHDQLAKVTKLPPGQPRDNAMQALQAVYQGLAGKVANIHDAASVMNPTQTAEQPAGPGGGILKAGANIQGNQFSPVMEKDRAEVNKQFTQAQQAEKVLKTLSPVFDTLKDNTTTSGRVEQLSRNFDIHGFNPIHSFAKMHADEDPQNRTYNAAQTQITSDIANALRGTNVSGEEIEKMVRDNTPVKGDDVKLIEQKKKNIEGFIKRSVPTSMLQKYGLTGGQD